MILLEATGNVKYGLPLMLTLMSAKFAGGFFNEGLYEEHIHLNHVPFLSPQLEPREFVSKLRVSDVMTRAPVSLQRFAKAGTVYRTLLATTHHCFPIVRYAAPAPDSDSNPTTPAAIEEEEEEGGGDGAIGRGAVTPPPLRRAAAAAHRSVGSRELRGPRFLGVVLRKHLGVLLQRKDFAARPADFARLPWHPLDYRDLEGGYPRYPRIQDLFLDRRELGMHLDLRAYTNPSPVAVMANTPLPQAYKLYRSLGLRHLCVTNHRGELVGILTRHELTEHRMVELREAFRASESTRRMKGTTGSINA